VVGVWCFNNTNNCDTYISLMLEIKMPLGQVQSISYLEVSSFRGAIYTENSILGPDEVSLFHIMSSFRRVAINRFHCIILKILN
jgi:hypothetical protein